MYVGREPPCRCCADHGWQLLDEGNDDHESEDPGVGAEDVDVEKVTVEQDSCRTISGSGPGPEPDLDQIQPEPKPDRQSISEETPRTTYLDYSNASAGGAKQAPHRQHSHLFAVSSPLAPEDTSGNPPLR